jgi:hypothetical protein
VLPTLYQILWDLQGDDDCLAIFYTASDNNMMIGLMLHDFAGSNESAEQACPRCKKKTNTFCSTCHFCHECHDATMKHSGYEKHDKITESTLKPVTEVNTKLDKELQEWEVESTKDGQDSQGH